MEEEVKAVDVKEIAAEEMGKKLLESMIGVVQSIKRPWTEMTQSEQDDAIGKMRFAVKVATTQAVRLIGSNGATHVVGTLDQITIKDGVKAVVQIGKNAENLPELFEAQGGEVMIICSRQDYLDGINEVKGEPDQGSFEMEEPAVESLPAIDYKA